MKKTTVTLNYYAIYGKSFAADRAACNADRGNDVAKICRKSSFPATRG